MISIHKKTVILFFFFLIFEQPDQVLWVTYVLMPNGARTQITFSSSTLASSLVRVKLEWDLRKGCLSLWDEIESFKQLRHCDLVYPFAHDEINFPHNPRC